MKLEYGQSTKDWSWTIKSRMLVIAAIENCVAKKLKKFPALKKSVRIGGKQFVCRLLFHRPFALYLGCMNWLNFSFCLGSFVRPNLVFVQSHRNGGANPWKPDQAIQHTSGGLSYKLELQCSRAPRFWGPDGAWHISVRATKILIENFNFFERMDKWFKRSAPIVHK